MPSGRIYAILDPVTMEPRYVGQTCNSAAHRLKQHLSNADAVRRDKRGSRVAQWMATLAVHPQLIVLEDDVDSGDLVSREKYWIARFRVNGHQLLNTATVIRSSRCKPGCTCKRHRGNSRTYCIKGCTCARHEGRGGGNGGRSCAPGCKCARHSAQLRETIRQQMTGINRTCKHGCTCKRHQKAVN